MLVVPGSLCERLLCMVWPMHSGLEVFGLGLRRGIDLFVVLVRGSEDENRQGYLMFY